MQLVSDWKNIVSLTLKAARTHLCRVCCTLSARSLHGIPDSHQPLFAYGMLNASRKGLVHHRGPEMKKAFQNRCYVVRRHNFSLLIGVSYDIHSSSMLAEPILILSPNMADSENHRSRQKHQNITGPSIKSSHEPYSLTQRSNRFPPPNRNKAYVCTLSLPKEEVRYRPTPRSMDPPPLDPPAPGNLSGYRSLRVSAVSNPRIAAQTTRPPLRQRTKALSQTPVYRIRTSQSPIHPPHKGTPHSPFVTPPTPD